MELCLVKRKAPQGDQVCVPTPFRLAFNRWKREMQFGLLH